MVDDTQTLDTSAGGGRQLAIPGVLVIMPTSDSGTPMADPSAWQRAVLRSCLPRAAKLIALALASHCGVHVGEPVVPGLTGSVAVCSPGLVTLAHETGYSRTHVQRQIRLLRDLGWLIGLSRPAARRPASFALSMSDSVRTSASVMADAVTAVGTAAAHPSVPRAGAAPAGLAPRRRRAGLRPASDRPSAAARRRARITGAAMAKALAVVGDNSVITTSAPAASSPAVAQAVVPPVIAMSSTVITRSAAAPSTAVMGPAGTMQPESRQPESRQPAQVGPARPASPQQLVAEAAEQVVGTLARAMRRDPETLAVARDRLVRILVAGSWNAAELAMHLVDTVGSSLGAGRVDDPVDHMLRRLDHLPASSSECLCRSCRSWAAAPATADHRAGPASPAMVPPAVAPPTVVVPQQVPASLPELAAIEQAAAAGAAQARMRPDRASGAA